MKNCPVYLATLLLLACFAACGDGSADPFCGDGYRDDGEICDGVDLAGASCQTLGFAGSALTCKSTCLDYNRGACTAPKSCGNNKKEGIEKCDGTDLAGKTCESLGFGKGALSCLPNCADFDITGCGAAASCGNNKKDPEEVCDGTDLAGATCAGLGFKGGELSCGVKCLGYDKSKCTKDCVPDCSNRKCGLDPVCGTPCGTCAKNHSCDATSFTCVKTCDIDPITANQVINVDLKTHKVSGEVTLNAQQMPDDPSKNIRAYLRFTNRLLNDSLSASLSGTGAGDYTLTLFSGTHDLTLGEGSSYQKVLPRITLPLRTGCYGVAGCTATDKDISASWRLIPSTAYFTGATSTRPSSRAAPT